MAQRSLGMTEKEVLASWVELDGCYNFRDLGGYRTSDGRRFRTGLVFRSDGLQLLSEADLQKLRDEIGLGAIIDLRSSLEVSEAGCGGIIDQATLYPVPLFPEAGGQSREALENFKMPSDMGDLYYLMLVAAQQPIVEVVRLLADFETPAVFHCAAGKDRTGVISALLLSLLGVPDETIILDYAFSRQNIDLINARLGSSKTYQKLMHDLPEGAYDADPACMKKFLAKLRESFGSAEGWAEQSGLDAAIRESLAARLLE
jgi:protein tyrosine/serine phosphatase